MSVALSAAHTMSIPQPALTWIIAFQPDQIRGGSLASGRSVRSGSLGKMEEIACL